MAQVTVLLADNDELIRSCLRRAVEEDANYDVRWEAQDGLQALFLIRQHHPQVVLLDAHMPRMDGLEVTHCLRERGCSARILLMSEVEKMRDAAFLAGADGFIMKEKGCEAIRDAIRLLLSPLPAGREIR